MKTYRLALLWLLPVLLSCRVEKNSAEASGPYSTKIDSLLELMTLEEKIGQMTLYASGWSVTDSTLNEQCKEKIRAGRCGNIYNTPTAEYTRELQRIAMEETRLGIPLLFGMDIIHGYSSIFPIPLAESCTWDLKLIERSARLSAREAAADGQHWTFGPMVDIARDPRWGSVAGGAGEDPYLGSLIGAAKVRGYQGRDLRNPATIMACVKHFAVCGAAQAGRVDLSLRTLREVYLPVYKAAIDAGAATVMTSFNEINGIPATGNEWLLTEVLRDKWGFGGFVVTDYAAINEMVPHGYAKDLKQAALRAINAGVDMDMQGGAFQDHLADLVKDGSVSEETIDRSVRRILETKYRLGLFENPYRYPDQRKADSLLYAGEIMKHLLKSARESIVLLKNEEVAGHKLLPLREDLMSVALIGPLGDSQVDMLGAWNMAGDISRVITLRAALEAAYPDVEINYAEGCKTFGADTSGFSQALSAARRSDLVIMAVGENHKQSGEAASRTELGLPGVQQALLEAICATGKPVIAVVMAGRPLAITWMDAHIPAILNAWHLGTTAGTAIVDVLSGKVNPSGKLTMTFPRNIGQIPIFYSMKNTGRPFDAGNRDTSGYPDVSNEPLYPFGYGLSYTSFEYSEPDLSRSMLHMGEKLSVSVNIINAGKVAGEEIVQLYIQDLFARVTRPVKELKGFRKIHLEPGESKTVTFELTTDDLAYYHLDWEWKPEPGTFNVYVGPNSAEVKTASFELLPD